MKNIKQVDLIAILHFTNSRLALTLSLTRNYRPGRHCYRQPATTDWHCLDRLQEYRTLKRTSKIWVMGKMSQSVTF